MPEEAADAAGNDGAIGAAALLAAVADDCVTVCVAQAVEVGGLLLLVLPFAVRQLASWNKIANEQMLEYTPSRLRRIRDLLVLAIGAGAHTLKPIADGARQAEGAGVPSVELFQQQAKGAGVSGKMSRVAVGAAHVAEPLDGHGIVPENRVDAAEVE
jgi:hypothetical protein